MEDMLCALRPAVGRVEERERGGGGDDGGGVEWKPYGGGEAQSERARKRESYPYTYGVT